MQKKASNDREGVCVMSAQASVVRQGKSRPASGNKRCNLIFSSRQRLRVFWVQAKPRTQLLIESVFPCHD